MQTFSFFYSLNHHDSVSHVKSVNYRNNNLWVHELKLVPEKVKNIEGAVTDTSVTIQE